MTDRRRLLQRLAFSESRHFSWDMFPANTMAYDRWLNQQLIVITIVFCYLSLPNFSLNIYKIGHEKTRKLSHLQAFDPPRLAPYHQFWDGIGIDDVCLFCFATWKESPGRKAELSSSHAIDVPVLGWHN